MKARVKGDLTATVWKDKRDVNMLKNMHHPLADFWNEYGNAVKTAIAQDYNRHMGYDDKWLHDSCFTSRHNWKWKKAVFSFTSWTFQFWMVLFSSPPVAQNNYTWISNFSWSGT